MEKTLDTLTEIISKKSLQNNKEHIDADKVFLSGATDEEINMTEEYLECKFLPIIRKLYKHVNGQSEITILFNGFYLQSLKDLRDSKDNLLKHYKKEIDVSGGIQVGRANGAVKPYYYHLKWIPILRADNEEISIDLDPPKKGVYGQVIYIDFFDDERVVLIDNFESLLLDIINRIKKGTIKYDPEYSYFVGESLIEEIEHLEEDDENETSKISKIKHYFISSILVWLFYIISLFFVSIFRIVSWAFSLFKAKS